MDIGLKVLSIIEEVADEQEKALPPLDEETLLAETGLDSLCLAIIVARLEDALGVDPFTASDEVIFPVTVGDFLSLYKNVDAA